ncbi:MAG: ChaN family lipoprotein [Geminicoccaceae bacterium]
MPRWFAYPVGPCLALALTTCQALPERWEHDVGTRHPLTGQIHRVADGAAVSEAALIADAGEADFVLIGERHDNLDHHRLQSGIVQALQRDARRPRALAFEMIAADRQLTLVEYLDAHPGDAAGLGAALDWDQSGWPDWALYEPIAGATLGNGGQIIAADLDPAQKRAVFEQGPQALRSSFVRRTGLDQNLAGSLTDDLRDELDQAHCRQAPPEVLAGMHRVQRARDAMMADRLAAASGKAGGILIAGNGHVRNDRGVPWYLARLEPGARVVSIGLLEVQDEVRRPPADLPYDYVWFTPRVDDRDPCAAHERDLQRLGASG